MKKETLKTPGTKEKYEQQYPFTPPRTAISAPQHPGGDAEEQLLQPRRPCCTSFAAISCLFGAFLVLTSLAVLFALYLTSLHDPTITLASARVVTPIPSPAANATNTTLGLDLLVCNPNGVAAFDHDPGTTLLRYRGLPLGSVQAGGGRVPAKGCEHVRCELALEGLFPAPAERRPPAAGGPRRSGGLIGRILDDAAQHGGDVPFDAQTRLQGTVHVLGVFRRKAVAAGTCHVVMKLSAAEISVQSYTCSQAPDL